MKTKGFGFLVSGLGALLGILFVAFSLSPVLYAHCQVPCGIYDDGARFTAMAEHIDTMEKAMKQIHALSTEKKINHNQVVRWVTNKEKHGEELADIITYYFMTQRLKPVGKASSELYSKYLDRLELLHHMLVYTMKAKQSTDTANIEKLRELLKKFRAAYTGK